jgi:hypothetical protein
MLKDSAGKRLDVRNASIAEGNLAGGNIPGDFGARGASHLSLLLH